MPPGMRVGFLVLALVLCVAATRTSSRTTSGSTGATRSSSSTSSTSTRYSSTSSSSRYASYSSPPPPPPPLPDVPEEYLPLTIIVSVLGGVTIIYYAILGCCNCECCDPVQSDRNLGPVIEFPPGAREHQKITFSSFVFPNVFTLFFLIVAIILFACAAVQRTGRSDDLFIWPFGFIPLAFSMWTWYFVGGRRATFDPSTGQFTYVKYRFCGLCECRDSRVRMSELRGVVLVPYGFKMERGERKPLYNLTVKRLFNTARETLLEVDRPTGSIDLPTAIRVNELIKIFNGGASLDPTTGALLAPGESGPTQPKSTTPSSGVNLKDMFDSSSSDSDDKKKAKAKPIDAPKKGTAAVTITIGGSAPKAAGSTPDAKPAKATGILGLKTKTDQAKASAAQGKSDGKGKALSPKAAAATSGPAADGDRSVEIDTSVNFCPHCGVRIASLQARFCFKCGKKVPRPSLAARRKAARDGAAQSAVLQARAAAKLESGSGSDSGSGSGSGSDSKGSSSKKSSSGKEDSDEKSDKSESSPPEYESEEKDKRKGKDKSSEKKSEKTRKAISNLYGAV